MSETCCLLPTNAPTPRTKCDFSETLPLPCLSLSYCHKLEKLNSSFFLSFIQETANTLRHGGRVGMGIFIEAYMVHGSLLWLWKYKPHEYVRYSDSLASMNIGRGVPTVTL